MRPIGGKARSGEWPQTRSFLYIDECLEGTVRLMRLEFTGPVNIGSEEMVSINQLADQLDLSGDSCPDQNTSGRPIANTSHWARFINLCISFCSAAMSSAPRIG